MDKIKFIDRHTKKIIVEKVPSENYIKFLYNNPLGKLPLHLIVKRKFFTKKYAKYMDNPKSKEKIIPFIKEHNINMNESLLEPTKFETFNHFFYRKLKPESRPIESGIVSPADGKILAFENLRNIKNFFIKGNKFTLKEFLQSEELSTKYQNATLIIIRLSPSNYHRIHFPCSGTITQTNKINGKYYSVSPYAIKKNFKIFCENKREYSMLQTKKQGNIIISEIGATMVGKIIQTYKPGSKVKKGDEKSYFAFGGSSVLMLIPSSKIKIDEDILKNTQKGLETSIKMGETIGK